MRRPMMPPLLTRCVGAPFRAGREAASAFGSETWTRSVRTKGRAAWRRMRDYPRRRPKRRRATPLRDDRAADSGASYGHDHVRIRKPRLRIAVEPGTDFITTAPP